MNKPVKSRDKKMFFGYTPANWINILLTLFFMFGFGFLTPFGTMTPLGMRILGIFIGIIYGYTTCEIVWPSLLAIVAFGICGYSDMASTIKDMMGHNVVFQCIVAFISAGALNYYGFGKWFTRWSLSRSVFKGRPMFYTWAIMVIFSIASIVINPIPLTILLFTVWLDISDSCGYSRDSNFLYGGMCGILLLGKLGGAMIPYTSWMYGLAAKWGGIFGEPLNLALMGFLTLLTSLVIITIYVLSLKYIFKVDFSMMKEFDTEKLGEESKTMRPRAKRILIIYVLTTLILIVSSTMSTDSVLGEFVNNTITAAGLYCLCAAILILLPSGEGDGKACIEFDAVKNSAINWQCIFMCAVTLVVGSALSSEETGFMPWITGVLDPIFANKSGLFILNFIIIVTLILTNIASNVAVGTAMIPILIPYIKQSGLNPQLAGAALIFIVCQGLLLPGSSAPASIFHAQKSITNGLKRIKFTAYSCLLIMVCTCICFSIFYIFM